MAFKLSPFHKQVNGSPFLEEKSTIKNPKFSELTQEEKDKQHAIARENKSIHTYKGVQFDPEDGALSRMPNPNHKKEQI
jgi:hypothetical protein